MSDGIMTTGQAATALGVSQQTVIRMFDAGLLKGYRVPGSKFRRILTSEVERVLRDRVKRVQGESVVTQGGGNDGR